VSVALPVHPFPARMAPDFVLERLPKKQKGRTLTILDPMMGSGTIPVLASISGHKAVGFDTDPLAVIISRTWAKPLDAAALATNSERVTESARARAHRAWRHDDAETQGFIDYWFDTATQRRLGALAEAIREAPPDLHDALWCSFSRLIITKDAGASRARDVSHSRPHRVRSAASFNVLDRFCASAKAVADRHGALQEKRAGIRRLRLESADARALPLRRETIDAVITSPPYLQAIDYLRGHRMSLVWMGYAMRDLRILRSNAIGSEKGLEKAEVADSIVGRVVGDGLSNRGRAVVRRYVSDLSGTVRELKRVLRDDGYAAFVVAEATLEGIPIKISALLEEAAAHLGLRCMEREQRELPASRRYLPPPNNGGSGALDRRMKTESYMTFRKDS
jgi:hypothetical protein